jgi:hypothetical protein
VDWKSQSPRAFKCPFHPSWTLIDLPTKGSILIYYQFVQMAMRWHEMTLALNVTVSAVDVRGSLVHTVLGIPGALLFANVDDLADVISVVGTDVREYLG